MSRHLTDLENLLRQLIDEHRKLLGHLEAQQASMKKLEVKAIEESATLAEATRMRIATLETRRRTLVSQLSLSLKIENPPTLLKLANASPQHRDNLLLLRDQLKSLIAQVATRSTIAGKLAGAVLGHLNTVVRVVASAVEQAGTYTKSGIPQVIPRIGVIEAIA